MTKAEIRCLQTIFAKIDALQDRTKDADAREHLAAAKTQIVCIFRDTPAHRISRTSDV